MEKNLLRDVIKNNIKDADAAFDDGINIIRPWLEEQVSDLVMKSAYQFKQFLNKIPDIQSSDEYNKDVLTGNSYILQDDVCNLFYNYKSTELKIDLFNNIPLEVERAIKVCKLIDFHKLKEELADFEFTVMSGKRVYIDTNFRLAEINDYYPSGYQIRLDEVIPAK